MRVGAGDPIATIGRTGRATAHHLHFEIRRNGSVYNPLYLLPRPRSVGQVEEGGGLRGVSMSDADDVIRDEPLDTLVEAEDVDQREETRDTSRANLAVYLREIAGIPLLTPRGRGRAGRRDPGRRRGGQAADDRGEPAIGRAGRPPLPQPRAGAARPHRGGQHRPAAGRREVRSRSRRAILDVRDVVDPPGGDPGARQPGAHDPAAGPRRDAAGTLRP